MANSNYELIYRLTKTDIPISERHQVLKHFAEINGWRPSDEIAEYPVNLNISNGHLIVEHGLEITAVITFLKDGNNFIGLEKNQQLKLLGLSYNNLIEWHFFPDVDGLTVIYNREEPFKPRRIPLVEQSNIWSADAFDIITEKKPNPNLKRLDNSLIDTLSMWKRLLRAEIGDDATNISISMLFNSILMVRAIEDNKRRQEPNDRQTMLDNWRQLNGDNKTIRNCIKQSIANITHNGSRRIPQAFLNEDYLTIFDSLDEITVVNLFNDFYVNRFTPYKYDFSIISKHALSRIYEHYVSLLRERETDQLSMFREVPDEIFEKSFGNVYTPQFIARFFARYLKENLLPKDFRNLKTIDPTCGSGIFLRTLLELQCDPRQEIFSQRVVEIAFNNIHGLDIDNNACEASKLSIALLYLVLTNDFLGQFHITNSEILEFYLNHPRIKGKFDVVITNPPFVRWEKMDSSLREKIKHIFEEDWQGKMDLYLAVLHVSLQIVKPGGFLLFVLPQAFLISQNSELIREKISKECWIRFIADFSEIPVFEGVGSYIILLILQKKPNYQIDEPAATIVRCKDFPGIVLQKALEGKRVSSPLYDIFEVSQRNFATREWLLLSPPKSKLWDKIKIHPVLDKFLNVKQGFITGADDIFIRSRSDIPNNEMSIYKPYLPDRKMKKYITDKRTIQYVFYPYINNTKKITERQLKNQFPKTWKYLHNNSDKLKERKSVKSRNCEWWSPVRPRVPESIFRPKIITPYLIMLPRFSLDEKGVYGVSHAPFLCPLNTDPENELLKYFLGILNSSIVFWQLSYFSHKYSRGYLKLEVKTLRKLRVPDPALVSPQDIKAIISNVELILSSGYDETIHNEIDDIVASIYSLSEDEKREAGYKYYG